MSFTAGIALAHLYINNDPAIANFFFGNDSLPAVTTGAGNLAIGLNALDDITTGNNNTAIGWDSQFQATTASGNVSVGEDALKFVTTGDNNTVVGTQAAVEILGGTKNIAIGAGALRLDVSGNYNTAIGCSALHDNLAGSNVAVGDSAGYHNTTGNQNVAIGINSTYTNSTGANNTLIGQGSGFYLTSSGNTGVGQESLVNLTSGANNTALGMIAGKFITDGIAANATPSNSVFLGFDTRAAADAQTNQIVIGYQAIGAGSNTATLGNSSITKTILRGNVGIGVASPSYPISVANATGVQGQFTDTSGSTTDLYLGAKWVNAWPAIGTANNTSFSLLTDSTTRVTITGAGNIGVGASPNANALLDISSTTKAFMPPRMTTVQKAAIASPTAGMVVYDSTLNQLSFYNGTSWSIVSQTTSRIIFSIGDGVSAITSGLKKSIEVTQNCTITGWKILSDDPSTTAGAVVFDIWRLAYATSYPPLVANTLINTGAGGVKPTVTASATSAASANVNNWSTALLAGDILRFNIDSVATFTSLTLVLEVTLT
jgi:hypothetical protein